MGTVILLGSAAHVQAIEFEDVTAESGISYVGESKGSAWGDFNQDGWPDIWVTNRYRPLELYVNNGDGTFFDSSFVIQTVSQGAYGAAWGDFDNDGDPDVLNMGPGGCGGTCGTTTANTLLVNEAGMLTDQAAAYGVDYSQGRGRMPLWFDWNNDGQLDVLLANSARPDGVAPTALFTQAEGHFVDDTQTAGISPKTSSYAQIARLAPGERPHVILHGWLDPLAIYDYTPLPFHDAMQDVSFSRLATVQDAAVVDLNGDLLTDVFQVRANEFTSAVILVDAQHVDAQLVVSASQKAFRFKAPGNVQFQIKADKPLSSFAQIYIGANAVTKPGKFTFELSSNDSAVHGIYPHEPGVDTGIYIGYEPTTGFWEVQHSASSGKSHIIRVGAESTISELTTVGFESSDGEQPDRLVLQTEFGFSDTTMEAGLGTPTSCGSVVAADFDNDMDLDLYLVCRDVLGNRPNLLYENRGDGTFREVPGAGGAAGSTVGRGDSAAAADYDRDGFIDLFVTNGDNGPSPFNQGPHQLLRNLGNVNHWLEIDLEGTRSNRDGVGAQVLATAGGVTQVRDQNAGIHSYNQDHQRLHFGLGPNTAVDRLVIHWPSGLQQTLTDVSADQVLAIVEGVVPDKEPTITAISNQTIDEDSSTAGLAFMVNDVETDPAALALTVSSSDQALIPDANLVLGGSGANRTLVVTPIADRSGGPVTITLMVHDGGATISTAFDVTVSPVNDPPMAQDDSASVNEGESININVAENDSSVDDALDLATINIITGPMSGDVSVRTDGTLDYYTETEAGATGDTFTYTISDVSGAASNIATVSVSITPSPASNGRSITEEEAIALGLDSNDPDGDTDDDGMSDIVEIGGDTSSPLDTDGDGVIDALEPGADAADAGIVSGLILASGDAVTISTAAGESLSQVGVTAVASASDGVEFLFGTISYTTSSPPGGSVTVGLTFFADLPENLVVYKVDSAGNYTELPTSIWTRVGARMMDITLTDGDPMTDLDGVVNGSIDDPIALGSALSAATSGSMGADGGGGGCVFNPAADKDPIFPALMLFFLIYLYRGYFIAKYDRQA